MGDSSQIYVFDLTKKILFSKAISPSQFDLFIKKYEMYKDDAKRFFDSFFEFINKNEFNFDEYKKLFFNREIISVILNKSNLPRNILKNMYNKNEYFEFISSCSL